MPTKNHLVIIILDSCRYDSFLKAKRCYFDKVGNLEKRFSYASWTAPSHYSLLMGQLPHRNQSNRLAAEIYSDEFNSWSTRLGLRNLRGQNFLPHLSLPAALAAHHYYSEAFVSMPVLQEASGLGRHFDKWNFVTQDFSWIIQQLDFSGPLLKFYFLNLSETHFPYGIKDPQPYLPGWNGIARDGFSYQGDSDWQGQFFEKSRLRKFHQMQIEAVESCDTIFLKLWAKAPDNTYFIITSDHGECFGEGGFFGHGPMVDPKVFEVPFLEGAKKL